MFNWVATRRWTSKIRRKVSLDFAKFDWTSVGP